MTSSCQREMSITGGEPAEAGTPNSEELLKSGLDALKSPPLTHAQESLYFLDQLTNGLPVYHMPQAFRLRGELDRTALARALETVVQRHEALRTRIVESEKGPHQEVVSSSDVGISFHDLSSVDASA